MPYIPPQLVLKAILAKKKITPHAFAKMLKLDPKNAHKIFKTESSPTFRSMVAWAEALKIDVKRFIQKAQ